MSEPAMQERVLCELWVSLAALIRSYVAAHDIGRPVGRALVDNGDGGRLTIRGESRVLAIEFNAGTGLGNWTLLKDEPGPQQVLGQGEFQLDSESKVEFSDRRGKMELEIAAEAFTARIFDEE